MEKIWSMQIYYSTAQWAKLPNANTNFHRPSVKDDKYGISKRIGIFYMTKTSILSESVKYYYSKILKTTPASKIF